MTTALNIPIDAAAARLRAASYTVERQGMHWRVAPPGGELAIASADEVRALALGLSETTTTAPIDALTITEADALARHEATIADGVKTFVAVGEALAIIRDDRLYRTTHASFNDYLIARWPEIGGRRQADRLIGAASVADDLRPIGLTLTSESQARPLAPLAPAERRAAMQSATTAAGGAPPTAKQVAQAVREIKPAPLPTPPDGWTIWQNDGETTVGLRHTSGYKISGDASEAATLVQDAAAASRWLRDLADWRVIYDPTCPPELNAFTAISDDRDPIAAHDLPTLALRAWRATLYEDDMPDVPDEVIDALYLAGYEWRSATGDWAKGHDRIDGETPIAELYYLAGLDAPPAATPPGLSPEAVAHRAIVAAQNDLEAKGWTVRRVAGGDYRLTIGADQYETSGAGVVSASLLLGARSFATPDDLMAAVNAIDESAPAPTVETPESRDADGPWFWASKSAAHPTAHHWHLSRVPPGGYVSACGIPSAALPTTGADASHCGVCARNADRRETIPIPLPPTTTTTTARTCECGQPGIVHANIGGISGWWCAICKVKGETEDLVEQLGDQYLDYEDVPHLGGSFHKVAWTGGGGGYYTYDDALSMLHSSAMQLRKQAAAIKPTTADPRAAATAWAAEARAVLKRCAKLTSVMFRLDEMQTAVAHVEALLALLSEAPRTATETDSPLSPIADRISGVERGIAGGGHHPVLQNELRACRRHLDRLVSDPTVDTAAWDALSHRIGEAQAQLIEMEQTV